MNLTNARIEEAVGLAARALRTAADPERALLDDFPAPVYATDEQGRLTYFNAACIAFSGRTPVTGADRWCVTWKLYNLDGSYLPHEECPMAVAIRERRPVRGVEAVAERPDGARVRFAPFATPLLDESGALLGAVNVLVPIDDGAQVHELKAQAARCRRLAKTIGDRQTAEKLRSLADDCDERARSLFH
jgi:PAS domain-containing protein